MIGTEDPPEPRALAVPDASAPVPWRAFDALPHAFGGPVIGARLRARPEDFLVDEVLAFGPDGDGEHCLLHVRKTGTNTEWVARQIAALAGVSVKAVGYAGLKDRHAITTQWFSVHLGVHPEPHWPLLAEQGIEVLERHRHKRKLKRGALGGNRFAIRLRAVTGDLAAARTRAALIAAGGVPNYFGPQRFGIDAGNLRRAAALFSGARVRGSRHQRGLWLSAARSQLFNEVLARRVERGDWCTALVGDRLQLRGSHSHFLVEGLDERLEERAVSGDAVPTGPLFGGGAALTGAEPAALEARVAAAFPDWVRGLAEAGLKQERRALRLDAEGIALQQESAETCVIRFTLPAGSYATTVLRELVRF